MADDAARSRLGRGLASLMGDVGVESQANERGARSQRKVPIEFVRANPRNPRKLFSEAELAELADSIRERGIIQPVVVRARGADSYEIIAGERRWRAAQRAGLHELPIVVLDVSDAEALELAIIENVQRSDLNPLEEATGYQSLGKEYNHTQEEIAKIVGKSRSHIANTLRLLNLPEKVKAYINSGKLTAGHARMLVGQPNAEELAEQIVNQDLNVREVEAIARKMSQQQAKPGKGAAAAAKDPDTAALEERLGNVLGLSVTISHRASGSGSLQVKYRTLEQLDDVIARLEAGPKLR
ncbi:ParB/RepB/Spo0J family partition protein [Rhodoplanes sp. Z2-YC6860]|uniref:ParB/RepB/Spo0J family partition protein n=1 Tax=Rhodoplanes sp. Z2-YC6860 TaxID=674703 RepID=UPI00078C7598|nr:ParB/RepB/Spo0J family partition protein [Rhodoplanes sp. Z2-YC6860]AMN38701.1 parB-like partition protein [Rhodoplanes sp. Z2-YC6860]